MLLLLLLCNTTWKTVKFTHAHEKCVVHRMCVEINRNASHSDHQEISIRQGHLMLCVHLFIQHRRFKRRRKRKKDTKIVPFPIHPPSLQWKAFLLNLQRQFIVLMKELCRLDAIKWKRINQRLYRFSFSLPLPLPLFTNTYIVVSYISYIVCKRDVLAWFGRTHFYFILFINFSQFCVGSKSAKWNSTQYTCVVFPHYPTTSMCTQYTPRARAHQKN